MGIFGAPSSAPTLVSAFAGRRWFAVLGRRLAPLDGALFRASRGRLTILGVQGRAMPRTLLLTTTGRRTGRPRTTPVMYLRDGERIAITSENFGQARAAAWPLNLEATPVARVQLGHASCVCRARLATPDEVERYWPSFTSMWPAHESYYARSGVRHMFVLAPLGVHAPR